MSEAPEQTSRAQYLTFRVARQEHALPVLDVREILPYRGATPVPLAPPAIRGLINLRGTAVPVVDLALVFGQPETEVTSRSCVVILDAAGGDDASVVGVLTEEVHVVVELGPDDLQPAPSFGTNVNGEYLSGMGKTADGFVPILDAGRLLELDRLAAVVAPSPVGDAMQGGEEQAPSAALEDPPAAETEAPEGEPAANGAGPLRAAREAPAPDPSQGSEDAS